MSIVEEPRLQRPNHCAPALTVGPALAVAPALAVGPALAFAPALAVAPVLWKGRVAAA